MTEAERRQALEQVAAEVRACRRCRLHEGRTEAVPGEGHPSTEVLLVGEAPGLNEDRQGRPFVGAAGGFLTELLGTVGWSREEVFITNVVKCRPPQNRDPEPDEIAACAPFLRRQVEVLDPALVVTLGRHSMGRFMPGARIGQVHGTTAPAPDETGAADALVFAMYHPAAALHQASLRQTLLDDMCGVPAALLEARRRRDARRAETGRAAAVEPEPGGRPTAREAAPGDEPVLAGSAVEPEPVSSSASALAAGFEPESVARGPEADELGPVRLPEPVDVATTDPAPAPGVEPEPPSAIEPEPLSAAVATGADPIAEVAVSLPPIDDVATGPDQALDADLAPHEPSPRPSLAPAPARGGLVPVAAGGPARPSLPPEADAAATDQMTLF